MIEQTVSRLRRALSHDGEDVEVSDIAERLMRAFVSGLSEEHALVFERILARHAQAAEELGEDATVWEIHARADEIKARPS